MLRKLWNHIGRRAFTTTSRSPADRRVRLKLEPLEDRTLLSVSLDFSGTQAIVGGTNINVSNESTVHQSEMTLDVNPTNPLNLAGFSHNINDLKEIDVFYTTDGGATWSTTTIDDGTNGTDDGLDNTNLRFDPAIAFDADGVLYIAYGHNDGTDTTLVVAHSTDGGATFEAGSVANGGSFFYVDVQENTSVPGVDKWHLATGVDGDDPSSGDQVVYVAYTQNVEEPNVDQRIVVAGSNDGGEDFTTPVIINDASISGTDVGNLFADPAVGPDGELYVSWHDINAGTILFDVDTDGLFDAGNDFGTDVTVRTVETTLFNTLVPGQPQRGIFNGPVLDVDRSGGTYDGRLYITFVDDCDDCTETDNFDVFLTSSDNDGTTWTSLGSDPGNVEDSTGTDFLPWVDVDQTTGTVNVIYYTSDGDQGSGNDDVHVRLATSTDGGSNFVTSNISTATSDEGGGYGGDYLEYIGLAVHDGTAHGLWSSRVAGGGQGGTDLEALTASVSFNSATNANALIVNGDDGDVSTDDTIIVRLSSVNSAFLEVLVNSVVQFTGLFATIDKITINGKDGNDTITVNSNLGSFDVTINGGAGNDIITGGNGNDTIEGGSGNDTLAGGSGSDTYVFAGGSNLGTDTITEAASVDSDTLDFTGWTAGGISINLATTGNQTVDFGLLVLNLSSSTGLENVNGTSSGDYITGNSRDNTLMGNAGADSMYGDSGNDYLYGGAGDDAVDGQDGVDNVYGEDGDDWVYGGDGNDYVDAGDGNDNLIGDAGDDTLDGGDGNDTFWYWGSTDLGTDIIYEAANLGSDTLDFSGVTAGGIAVDLSDANSQEVLAGFLSLDFSNSTGLENVIGSTGGDTITGNTRNNTFTGGQGNDALNGGSGSDTYVFSGSSNLGTDTITEAANVDSDTLDFTNFTSGAISIDLSNPGVQVILAGKLSLAFSFDTSLENVNGTSSGDSITGNSRDNTLMGNAGNDSIYGGSGNDYLYGGDGSDTLYGDAGADYLSGDADDDNLYGGDGNDSLAGGAGNDFLHGEAGDDSLDGGADNDVYHFEGSANLGTDTIYEAANADTDTLDFSGFTAGGILLDISDATLQELVLNMLSINLSSTTGIENVTGTTLADDITGNTRDNVFYGGAGDDILSGGAGADTLYGEDGDDTLNGDAGNDMLYGGDGVDTIRGGTQDDLIFGDAGDDFLYGDLGADILHGGAGNDFLDAGGDPGDEEHQE
ncbi:MAG: hypothetical protein IID44_16110 [Planctomycetes bacterium]|nr:hypothetical protein [Planctomycetota bacterium]